MKQFFILAVAAVAATAACTKNEVTEAPNVPVSFEVASYRSQTKAADPTAPEGSFLRVDDHFSSQAFLHAQGVDLDENGAVNGSTFQQFFGSASPWSETITWDGTNKKWAPSNTYYWPKGSQSFVNFVSWYGATPTVSYAYTSSKWTATMTFAAADISNSSDILYADMAWRYKANESTYHKDDAGVVGVPTLFRHGLSRIAVKAYVQNAAGNIAAGPSDANASWVITIKNFTLGSVTTSGNLVLTNADPGSKGIQEWTATVTSPASGNISASDAVISSVAKASATDVVALRSVLPQTIANTVKMNFDLDIVKTTSGNTQHEIIPVELTLDAFGTSAWAKNTQYTYYIKIDPTQNEVLYDPAVESDWVEETTNEQSI